MIKFIVIFFITIIGFVLINYQYIFVTGENFLPIYSAKQLIEDEVSLLHQIKFPIAWDLSKFNTEFISMYPPGIGILYFPCAYLTENLGVGIKLFSFVYFIFGTWGYIKILKVQKIKITILIFFTVLIISNWNYLTGYDFKLGDILAYAYCPWVYIYTKKIINGFDKKISFYQYMLYGLFCGLSYVIKFSLSIITMAVMTSILITLLKRRTKLEFRTFMKLMCIAIGTTIPITTWMYITWTEIEMLTSATEKSNIFNELNFNFLIELILSVFSFIVFNLFSTDFVIQHIVFFSGIIPLDDISFLSKNSIVCIIILPLSLLSVFLICKDKNTKDLFLEIILPYTIYMLILTLFLERNLLLNSTRLHLPLFIILEIQLISTFLNYIKFRIFFILFYFFIMTESVTFYSSINNHIARIDKTDLTSYNGLNYPSFDNTDLKAIQDYLSSKKTSHKQYVCFVDVSEDFWGGSGALWFLTNESIIPVMFDSWKFSDIFNKNYDAHNDVRFTSSESYDVSIVFSYDSRDFKNKYIKKFPQIKNWEEHDNFHNNSPLIISGCYEK